MGNSYSNMVMEDNLPPGIVFKLEVDKATDEILSWAQKNIHEDPDRICQEIEEFRDLIYAKGECTPHRMDDAFLLRFLRGRNFNLESAHKLIVNYCKFKINNPELFENVNLNYLFRISCDDIITVPPYREQTGRRILLYKLGKWDPNKYTVTELFQTTMASLELAILEPQAQILGGIGLFDLSDLTWNQAKCLTPSVAKKMVEILVTSFPMKIHAIHIVYQSKVFDMIYKVFQPFINSKMKKKVFFHGNNMKSLHKHIYPEHLDEKYEGRHGDYDHNHWIVNFSKNQFIKNELISLGYILDDYVDE